VVPSGDLGLARVVAAVRAAVVVSIIVLAAIGPEWMRRHPVLLTAVLAGALAYAAVLIKYPNLEVRRTRYSWLVAALDMAFTLSLIWLTGGPASPVVVVLTLVVIASAARLTLAECLVLATLSGIGYLAVVLASGDPMPRWASRSRPSFNSPLAFWLPTSSPTISSTTRATGSRTTRRPVRWISSTGCREPRPASWSKANCANAI
jgi:hypothetical protein